MAGCFRQRVSYQVKSYTRPELQSLLKQRIAEADKAKTLRPTQQPAAQELSTTGGLAAAHPSACLVSHRAVEGRSLLEPQLEPETQLVQSLPMPPCLVLHRTGDEDAGGSSRQKALPVTLEEWIDAAATAIAKAMNGKAPGRDQVTNEIMKAAGPPFVLALAMCLQRISTDGPPLEWRGGKMWPGKKTKTCLCRQQMQEDYFVPQK